MTDNKRPKVGLALSGASSRSIFYIGFLEVLQENDFPVDFISAMSGSAVVAASFACGSMQTLKKAAFEMDKEVIFSLVERSKGKGGIYNLEKVEEWLRLYTKNHKFEEVHPRLGIVATDITAGEEVVLQVGDIARAICASCTLPGIFKPMPWGNKNLIDGGILNVVPGNVARQAGLDVVIGIDMRATRFVFSKWQIMLKRILNTTKRIIWPNQAGELWQRVSSLFDYSDSFDPYSSINDLVKRTEYPNLFSVLGRSLDLAIEAQRRGDKSEDFDCDLLIVPEVVHPPFYKKLTFLHFTDFSRTEEYYLSGRKTAENCLPKMWQLLADFEQNQTKQDQVLEKIIQENQL